MMFDNDTAIALKTRAKVHRDRFRSVFGLFIDINNIEDPQLMKALYERDGLTCKALADILESSEFTAEELAEGICLLVETALDHGLEEGLRINELIASDSTSKTE